MKSAAFFDIDGTLVRCLTQKELLGVFWKKKIISTSESIAIFFWFFLYKVGLLRSSTRIRQYAYRSFRGLSVELVAKLIQNVYEQKVRHMFSTVALERLEAHRKRGDSIFAISGTLDFFCHLICLELNIPTFYGTRLEVKNDYCTGNWEGVILEGETKADLVRRLAKENDIDLKSSFAYADHYSDVFFLKETAHPVVVNPDKKLKKEANLRKWEILIDQ